MPIYTSKFKGPREHCPVTDDLLHSRTGRMEAKGCAKSCVWKDARRHFYWSLRARLARSRILAQFAEAYPESTSEYRSQVLTQLAPLIGSDLRQDAETLESLDISAALSSLRAGHVAETLRDAAQVDKKATLNGLLQLVGDLSDEEKATILSALQNSS